MRLVIGSYLKIFKILQYLDVPLVYRSLMGRKITILAAHSILLGSQIEEWMVDSLMRVKPLGRVKLE